MNKSCLNDLKGHFSSLPNEFLNQISQRIDLNEYLEKIYENAELYEYWESDILVGFAAVYENSGIENPAYLTNLSIIKSHNGMGIASKLLDFIIDNLKKKRFTQFMLEVKKNNTIAFDMYKKRGFISAGEKENDYCLMQLFLG